MFDPAVVGACVPKGEGALDLLVDEVLPNPKENEEVVELAGGSPGAADVDGVVDGAVELPPNTDDDFGASASLLAVDEDVLPPLPNENVDLDA